MHLERIARPPTGCVEVAIDVANIRTSNPDVQNICRTRSFLRSFGCPDVTNSATVEV